MLLDCFGLLISVMQNEVLAQYVPIVLLFPLDIIHILHVDYISNNPFGNYFALTFSTHIIHVYIQYMAQF